jgi:hypothetical protein
MAALKVRGVFHRGWQRVSGYVPTFSVALTLLAVLVESQVVFPVGEAFMALGFHVYLADVAALFTVLALFVRTDAQSNARSRVVVILSLSALVAVGYLARILAIGLKPATVEWKIWLWALPLCAVALVHGTRARWAQWRLIVILVGLVAAVGTVVAVYVLGFQNFSTQRVLDSGGSASFYGSRPISGASALLMVASLPLLMRVRLPDWFKLGAATILGLGIVICQVRAVWLALIAVIITMGIWGVVGRRCSRVLPLVGAVSLAPLVFISTPLLGGPDFLPGNGMQVTSAPSSTSGPTSTEPAVAAGVVVVAGPSSVTDSTSVGWRVELWQSFIEGYSIRPLQLLEGQLMGGSPTEDDPSAQDPCCRTSAHSQLFQVTQMLGLVGTGLVIGVMAMAFRDKSSTLGSDRMAIVAISAYGLVNTWPAWIWLLLGVGMATDSKGQSLLGSDIGYKRAVGPSHFRRD